MSQTQTETQQSWAKKEWFRNLYLNQGTTDVSSYYAHDKNGYQKYRHAYLCKILSDWKEAIHAGSFLDIGCANGYLTQLMYQALKPIKGFGIEFVSELVEEARDRYPLIDFKEGALPQLPYPDEAFDLVIASEVIYYLTNDARIEAVREVSRVLGDKGWFLFTSVIGNRYFSVDSAVRLLQPEFEIVYVKKDYVHWYHKLIAPFFLTLRLNAFIEKNTLTNNGKINRKLSQYENILKSAPIRAMVRFLSRLSAAIIEDDQLPAMVSGTIHRLSSTHLESNILILLRKK